MGSGVCPSSRCFVRFSLQSPGNRQWRNFLMVNRGGVGAVLARGRAAMVFVCLAFGGFFLLRHDISTQTGASRPAKSISPTDVLGRLPLIFEPNQGQAAPPTKFEARGSGYGLYLTASEAVLSFRDGSARSPKGDHRTALLQM